MLAPVRHREHFENCRPPGSQGLLVGLSRHHVVAMSSHKVNKLINMLTTEFAIMIIGR